MESHSGRYWGLEPEPWGWCRGGGSVQPYKNVSLGEEVRTTDVHLGIICRGWKLKW